MSTSGPDDFDDDALVAAYLDHLRARGRASTATCYAQCLGRFRAWLAASALGLRTVTLSDLESYLIAVAAYRTHAGRPLAVTTQATHGAVVRSFFRWMHRRGLLAADPAAGLARRRVVRRRVVAKDWLTLDESLLLLGTLVERERSAAPGTTAHALAQRNVALIALALASGLRAHSLLGLNVEEVEDDPAPALRIARAKGRPGRVLPTAAWAVAAVRTYVAQGRAHLLGDQAATTETLFVSQRQPWLSHKGYTQILATAVRSVCAQHAGCPSVAALATKRVTTHSLRVTAARCLHDGGCDPRSIAELLLHGRSPTPHLATTGRYLPLTVGDLARSLRGAHPRG